MAHPKGNSRPRGVHLWHRRLGLAAAAFLALIVVTGVLVNHGREFGLDDARVRGGVLGARYAVAPEAPPVSFQAGDRWFSAFARTLFVDGTPVAERVADARGAVAAPPVLVFASAQELFLIAPDGAVIERSGAETLPGAIERIGTAPDGRVVIDTSRGRYAAAADFLGWSETDAAAHWSAPRDAPPAVADKLAEHYGGPGVPASRVVLDIHSGRILGPWGPYLVDALAAIFLLLAITGVINWWRMRR